MNAPGIVVWGLDCVIGKMVEVLARRWISRWTTMVNVILVPPPRLKARLKITTARVGEGY